METIQDHREFLEWIKATSAVRLLIKLDQLYEPAAHGDGVAMTHKGLIHEEIIERCSTPTIPPQ